MARGDLYKVIAMMLLPYVLFYLSFRVFYGYFLYVMAISTAIMGLAALTLFPELRSFYRFRLVSAAASLLYAALAYLIFYMGWIGVNVLGLQAGVYFIYNVVPDKEFSLLALTVIGLLEEPYWRGFVQQVTVKRYLRTSWLVAPLFYGVVHLVTGDVVLPLAAFFFGLVMSWAAERHGLLTSSLAHVIWLYVILYLVPVIRLPLP